ncbi:unnamed protein product (macronuclear) [Paramecium tetraurelia]|uniref:Galactose mutarotase N-terminal barrel domain-containing protein n=1 Tax=Paramecium tetraurelia TaxID=5888 RepID=A0BNE0_PARTE|nr:uncharacterized protein GSPATT00030695001 [Paramecium tetraurelia]CAK60057.1 unnamed protein product [Paramecium tetraurelia]|eukprot:XP_001427455.1 hypothetical protein (macronuclear) [Paramecium tetraurelia strain d4-2]
MLLILYIPLISASYLYENSTLITQTLFYEREGNPMYNLSVLTTQESYNQLDIKIEDLEKRQFHIPSEMEPFKSIYNDIVNPIEYSHYDYETLIDESPFKFNVIRVDTQETILSLFDIIVSELYSEFTVKIPTKYFFGLGERNQKGFRFKEGIYTLMAKDVPQLLEDGKQPGKGVYSSHPVYLMRERSGKYHVLFFKNSSPMDVVYKEDKLTFKYIGGILQLKLFLGDYDPETAVKLYHSYLGGWALHPFWAMGYHHSRWPIKSSEKLKEYVHNHKENDIPIDTIWSDIDYMNDRQIFSVDETRFHKSDFEEIQNQLGVNYIPIIDVAVGVKYGKQDKGFREGINLDIFLRSPNTGQRFRGNVWPGSSYFPDFFHPNCSTYWRTMIKHLYQSTNFSGLWIDMNEPTNFCDGECDLQSGGDKWNSTMDYTDINEDYKNNHIRFPYIPGVSPLEKMTLPPNLYHYGKYLHKDVHNLYGLQESYETYQAQKEIGKPLPFIISRSTFPGSGHFTQHWEGDNEASYTFLYLSVGSTMQFNIFGIPMVGADVCGFLDNTTPNLCARWVQLGSLYPFFRNHNNDRAKDQEFYSLGQDVYQAARRNIKLRYSIIKWYYSLFLRSNHTGTIFRPVFFEFNDDVNLFKDEVLDTQFLIGDELIATPILIENQTIRKAYFPKAYWYHFLSGSRLQKQEDPGLEHFIVCKYTDYVPLYIRGGSIILQQNITNVRSIKDLKNHFHAVIAIGEKDSFGTMIDLDEFSDQKILEKCDQSNCILNVNFSIQENKAEFTIVRADNGKPASYPLFINRLKIYGLSPSQNIKCSSNKIVECSYSNDNTFPYISIIELNEGIGLEFGETTDIFKLTLQFS